MKHGFSYELELLCNMIVILVCFLINEGFSSACNTIQFIDIFPNALISIPYRYMTQFFVEATIV